jgi:hypothetical protein
VNARVKLVGDFIKERADVNSPILKASMRRGRQCSQPVLADLCGYVGQGGPGGGSCRQGLQRE